MYLATLLTLVLIGSRCGLSCSPNIGIVLSSNALTYADSTKKAFVSYLSFYIGKLSAVVVLCTIAHIAGSGIVEWIERLSGSSVNIILKLTLVIIGIYYIVSSLRNKKCCGGGCASCRMVCSFKRKADADTKLVSPFLIGIAYGATPCAPLILLLTQSVSMNIAQAILAAVIFTAANAVSPVIILLIISVLVQKKTDISSELARGWLKTISGAIMIISGLTLTVV